MIVEINPTKVTNMWLDSFKKNPYLSPKDKARMIAKDYEIPALSVAILGDDSPNPYVRQESRRAFHELIFDQIAPNVQNYISF